MYSSCEYYKDNILLLNGSHLFSVISYVVLIVINHPKLALNSVCVMNSPGGLPVVERLSYSANCGFFSSLWAHIFKCFQNHSLKVCVMSLLHHFGPPFLPSDPQGLLNYSQAPFSVCCIVYVWRSFAKHHFIMLSCSEVPVALISCQ